MMSDEELVAWERALDENGVPGLRSTRLQCYDPRRRILSARQQQLPDNEPQLHYQ
jgi:hypothetical protein